MQSEESDGSRDVPPLSCRGSLKSSKFVQLNIAPRLFSPVRTEEVPA